MLLAIQLPVTAILLVLLAMDQTALLKEITALQEIVSMVGQEAEAPADVQTTAVPLLLHLLEDVVLQHVAEISLDPHVMELHALLKEITALQEIVSMVGQEAEAPADVQTTAKQVAELVTAPGRFSAEDLVKIPAVQMEQFVMEMVLFHALLLRVASALPHLRA